MPGSRNSKTSRNSDALAVCAAVLLLAALSASFAWLCEREGWLLYYGDANAHLNIARRVLDSRTPGYDQIGTVWLPLPHVLMLPLVRIDAFWRTGLAGTIPSAVCYILAGTFLLLAAKRIIGDLWAAAAAAALFALNPNVLYLQTTAMTEPVFFAAFMALLYFCVRGSAVGAGLAALAGTLTRYEGWFVIPFAAAWFFATANGRRIRAVLVFGAIASIGPLYWLGHNWWCCGSALAFYDGPNSPRAIQGGTAYPGLGDWRVAWLYFRTAAQACAGAPLVWLGVSGMGVLLWRRAVAAALLTLPPVFYVWSMQSSGGSPVFVPTLEPHSYYNTRYGLSALPLLALGAGTLVAAAPQRWRLRAAVAIAAIVTAPWLLRPTPEAWITWKESQVNSSARREWTARAVEYLRPRYGAGEGIFTTFGDITGIYRELGIPLERTLTWDNWPLWPAAVARPELFLWERWAVAVAGDPVQTAILKAGLRGPRYKLETAIKVKGASVIEIYRRDNSPETLASEAAVPARGRDAPIPGITIRQQ